MVLSHQFDSRESLSRPISSILSQYEEYLDCWLCGDVALSWNPFMSTTKTNASFRSTIDKNKSPQPLPFWIVLILYSENKNFYQVLSWWLPSIKPGKSAILNCFVLKSIFATFGLRVVNGSADIVTFILLNPFNKVDFPAFGYPINATSAIFFNSKVAFKVSPGSPLNWCIRSFGVYSSMTMSLLVGCLWVFL